MSKLPGYTCQAAELHRVARLATLFGVITPPAPLIQPVCFAEAEFAGRIDVRRWRAGERNTRYGPSPIQGHGSFAVHRIPRGAAVLVREPLAGHFPVNHSDTPNTARALNRAGLFALHDIAAGEEITEDYRFLPYFAQAIPHTPLELVQATPEEYRRFLAERNFLPGAQRSGPRSPSARGTFQTT